MEIDSMFTIYPTRNIHEGDVVRFQGVKQIRLTQGLYTLVDEQDYEFLMQWSWSAALQSRGTKWYAVRTCNETRRQLRMHIVIAQERMHKIIPPKYVVDHINHNSLDNRRNNFEVITQRENMLRSPNWKRKGVKVCT